MDFIIAWVDGNDPKWQNEYKKYKNGESESTDEARFRNWNNLHYWFRGVEKFAPWVDKIHFVTWGHLPKWLNTDHPQINIVNHEDFIPGEYLPTFNSRTIDLNFHRINGLSEEYVYFNDDMFLIDQVRKNHFFRDGKPCDAGIFSILNGAHYHKTLLRNLSILKKSFSKKETVREKPSNWLNVKYGKHNLNNLLLYPIKKESHSGFVNFHLPQPSRKKTLEMLWEREFRAMNEACQFKFRNYYSVNQYLQRYWELASNNFHPMALWKFGKLFRLHQSDMERLLVFIEKREKPMLCLNDFADLSHENFEKMRGQIIAAFDDILPEKSEFER